MYSNPAASACSNPLSIQKTYSDPCPSYTTPSVNFVTPSPLQGTPCSFSQYENHSQQCQPGNITRVQPLINVPTQEVVQVQQGSVTFPEPLFPSPVPGMFLVYPLQFCPEKTKICFGCSQSLKPNGEIQPPPYDLVIVSNMEREWNSHRRHGNVYFHCCLGCVHKKHSGAFHLTIPINVLHFLKAEHKTFLQETFKIIL